MNETPDDVVDDNIDDSIDIPTDVELQAMLDESGVDMMPEDFVALREALPEMIQEDNPPLAAYLEEMSPRLNDVLKISAEKKEGGDERGSVDVLVLFMEEEMKKLEGIPDEALRGQIISVLGDAVNFKQLAEDLKKHARADVASGAVDLIPVVGAAKITGEAALGKTASGQKLEGGRRVWHAMSGLTFLALDIAGLGTAGVTTAVSEAGRVAKGAGKTAEVAMLTMKVARIANLLAKSAKFGRTAQSVAKFGNLITKYPKLSLALIRMHKWKKEAKIAYRYSDTMLRAKQLADLHAEVEKNA